MRVTNKIKVSTRFFLIFLLAILVLSSCKPKANHLTQNLENSAISGQSSTLTAAEATLILGQETAPVQSPTSVNEPTAVIVEPATPQAPSVTVPPVQTPTSIPVVLSQTVTKKSSTSQATTSTPAPTQTLTATPTKTATLTLTPFPTLQTGWADEWTFYLDNGNGGYYTDTLSITLNGKEVFAQAVINGSSYEFVGQLNSDETSIMGDYTKGTETGWFYWVILSDSQFGGMMDNSLAFCASRNGADRPGQCGYFIIS